MNGQRFGRLVVVDLVTEGDIRSNDRYRCICDCGTVKVVRQSNLKNGRTVSCGCYRREKIIESRLGKGRHNCWNTKLYRTWNKMKGRCLCPTYEKYPSYGARGITVCEEWLDFVPFREWAEANGYQEGLSIGRIDNDGNYEPSNCRWVTMAEQAANRRNTIQYKGTSLMNYCKLNQLPYQNIRARLRKGMTIDEAINDVTKEKE